MPHVTDAIQEWVERVAQIPVDGVDAKPEICIIEVRCVPAKGLHFSPPNSYKQHVLGFDFFSVFRNRVNAGESSSPSAIAWLFSEAWSL